MNWWNWTFLTKLWLIQLEQITPKPFAWMLIYDTITTNHEEENTFDLSVPWVWARYKLYKSAWIGGIGPFKPKLWLIETWTNHTQAICMNVNLWYDHDKFKGKNTFDSSVPWVWAHYKLYKNAWIGGFGPSKPRLWLIELEQITTKPYAWMLICDTITTNLRGKTLLIQVFHGYQLITSYIKILELVELDLPNKGYG